MSDLQISNSFQKPKSFYIEVKKGIFFPKQLFRGLKFDLMFCKISDQICDL